MTRRRRKPVSIFFFFNDTATTEIYTLSLHDALPILSTITPDPRLRSAGGGPSGRPSKKRAKKSCIGRSEEHTSELQSRLQTVCRPLLEKKKNKIYRMNTETPLPTPEVGIHAH